MSHRLTVRTCLLGSLAGSALLGILGTGEVQAALVNQTLTNGLATTNAVADRCVEVAVPTASATLDATLTVSAAGSESTTRSSTEASTGSLGTVRVCVQADAGARISLHADATAATAPNGTALKVTAAVAGEAGVSVKVTVNGARVL